MKSRNRESSDGAVKRPLAVDMVVALVLAPALLALAGGVLFALVAVYLMWIGERPDLQAYVLGMALLVLSVGTYLAVVAIEFRRLRKWTYRHVDFLITWSGLGIIPGIQSLLRRPDVRRAFRSDAESDSQDPADSAPEE